MQRGKHVPESLLFASSTIGCDSSCTGIGQTAMISQISSSFALPIQKQSCLSTPPMVNDVDTRAGVARVNIVAKRR